MRARARPAWVRARNTGAPNPSSISAAAAEMRLGLLVALERRCERAERPGDRSHHQRAADGEPTGARNQELV